MSNELKLVAAGVYPMFLRSKLSDYRGSEYVVEKVKKYYRYIEKYPEVKHKGHGIMFCGSPVTSGSDLLINTIAKKAILSNHTAKLISVHELLDGYKEAGFRFGPATDVDFLCLTGFGSAPPTDFEKRVISQLLSDRYYKERPVCLISAVPLMDGEASILAFYGDEIAEIIDNRCLVLECVISRHKKESIAHNLRTEIFGEDDVD